MSPPRKDPIPNWDKKTLGLEKDQCLTSDLPPFIPGKKSLRNEENDDNPETIDNSHTEKYDTSHINRYDSIGNVKETKNTNDDDKYKEDTSRHQEGNESVDNPETSNNSLNKSVINTTKQENN